MADNDSSAVPVLTKADAGNRILRNDNDNRGPDSLDGTRVHGRAMADDAGAAASLSAIVPGFDFLDDTGHRAAVLYAAEVAALIRDVADAFAAPASATGTRADGRSEVRDAIGVAADGAGHGAAAVTPSAAGSAPDGGFGPATVAGLTIAVASDLLGHEIGRAPTARLLERMATILKR